MSARPTVEGAYPLFLDGATCGCYGDVLIREQRGGIPWKQCALHAEAPALLAALRDLREACADAYKAGRIPAEPVVRAGNVIAKATA